MKVMFLDFGGLLNTKVAGTTLMKNTYQSNNGTLQKSTYGNGDYKEYSYDSVGRTTLVKNNGSNAYYWRYNANGKRSIAVKGNFRVVKHNFL